MALSRVNFEEWTPDQPGITNGLQRAENVYPKAVGYGPIPTAVNYSNAASEDLNNVVAGKSCSTNCAQYGVILFTNSSDSINEKDVNPLFDI